MSNTNDAHDSIREHVDCAGALVSTSIGMLRHANADAQQFDHPGKDVIASLVESVEEFAALFEGQWLAAFGGDNIATPFERAAQAMTNRAAWIVQEADRFALFMQEAQSSGMDEQEAIAYATTKLAQMD